MKFTELRTGDVLFILEQDRRTQYPIFDTGKIIKISEPKYDKDPSGEYSQVIAMTIQDSVGTSVIAVPLAGVDAIYDKVYYTPNPDLILQEMQTQRARAQNVIDNVPRYEAIAAECDKISARINKLIGRPDSEKGVEAATHEGLSKEVDQRLSNLEAMVGNIYEYFKTNDNNSNGKNEKVHSASPQKK